MSDDKLTPVEKLHIAISEFIHEVDGEEYFLEEWFIGYGAAKFEPDMDPEYMQTLFKTQYATSDRSPWGAVGVGRLALKDLERDLLREPEEDDEEDEA